MTPRRRDAIAEWSVVALVVLVLGVTAVRTKLDPDDEHVARIAAQVRMTSPIARACVPDDRTARGCLAIAPIEGRSVR